MRRERERGTLVEIVPVLIVGILLMIGALQMSLYMTGKHGAELAAFRAARAMEMRAGSALGPVEASSEAQKWCRVGYPFTRSATFAPTGSASAVVSMRMTPLFPSSSLQPFTALRVNGQYPPRIAGR